MGASRTRSWTGSVWALALVAIGGVSPAAASAGTVELRDDRLVISGGDERDRLQLERVDERFRIEQRQPDAELTTPSAACQSATVGEVECPAAGVGLIEASTGAGNDRFVVGGSFPASDERGACRGNELGARLEVRMGKGRNYAELSRGPDLAAGGDRRDLLLGCQGNDEVRGRGGGDRLSGDVGNDSIRGGKGRDWLIGCVYDPDDVNYPRGEPGKDELRGGGGADFLYGCQGVDRYRAGDGNDTLNTRDGKGERLACGGGRDLVYVDPSDRLRSCERQTNCTTDNFPFYPCSRRQASARGPSEIAVPHARKSGPDRH